MIDWGGRPPHHSGGGGVHEGFHLKIQGVLHLLCRIRQLMATALKETQAPLQASIMLSQKNTADPFLDSALSPYERGNFFPTSQGLGASKVHMSI